jgi:copper transport protein
VPTDIAKLRCRVIKVARTLAVLGVAIVAMVAADVRPAAAHTSFESSDPADGSTRPSAVSDITLTFTAAAEPAGEGFVLLDADGQLRAPDQASSADGRTWVLRFEPPLEGGLIGLRWSVKAPDAHPIEGSFSFEVIPLAVVPITPETTTSATVGAPAEPDPVEDIAAAPAAVQSSERLELFLSEAEGSSFAANRLGEIGRTLTLSATLVGVGALAFAASVLRGTASEVRLVLFWVRRAGLIVMLGALIESTAQVALEAGGFLSITATSIGDALWAPFGVAVAARVLGGVMLTAGAQLSVAGAGEANDPIVAIRTLVGSVTTRPLAHGIATETMFVDADPQARADDHAWILTEDSGGAFFGAAVLVLSFLFDGHTASEGPLLVTAFANVVHVTAAAVWVGGIMMLVAVLSRRRRFGHDLRSLHLAARFSVVAAGALVAVAIAGGTLAVVILDSPSELVSTAWGRLLVAKSIIVAVAALAGGYNHKVLIPALTKAPDDQGLAEHFRLVVGVEAIAIAIAIVTTALLVAAST